MKASFTFINEIYKQTTRDTLKSSDNHSMPILTCNPTKKKFILTVK